MAPIHSLADYLLSCTAKVFGVRKELLEGSPDENADKSLLSPVCGFTIVTVGFWFRCKTAASRRGGKMVRWL